MLGDPAVTVGVRPEHLHEGPGERLRLEAEVEAVEHLGESSTLYLALPDTARRTGRKLAVGYILRHHPSWMRLVEIA